MAFWGASDAQKEATGRARELGAWQFGQIPEWLGRAQYGAGQGEQIGQWGQDYWRQRADQGFYTPEEVRGFGQQIMPGVDQAVANRQGRLEGIGSDWGNTEADIRQRLDQQAGNVNTTFDQGRDTIAGAYGRVGQRGENVNREITGNIAGTYGSAAANTADAYGGLKDASAGAYDKISSNTGSLYGGLRGDTKGLYGGIGQDVTGTYGGLTSDTRGTYGGLQGENQRTIGGLTADTSGTYAGLQGANQGTYGELQGQNAQAYGAAGKTLDRMNPLGDFRGAEVTRSYAPAMAATRMRLRAAGVDPNSAEGQEQQRRVETARARGVDDAYASQTEKFVDRKNAQQLGEADVNRGLALGKLAGNERLSLGRLGDTRGLTLTGADVNRQLGLGRLGDERSLGLGRLDTASQLQREAGAVDRGLATDAGAIQRQTAVDRLMNNQGLTERGSAIDRGLALQSGADFRDEIKRNQGLSNEVDLGYLGASQTNDMNRFNALQNQFNQQNQFAGQAYAQRAGLANQMNAEDLQRLDLQNAQWGAGMNYGGVQRGGQNQAAQQLGQLGQQYAQNAFGAANQAQGFGRGAQGAYDQSYQYEAPNAGWGTKLITGAVGAGLNMVAPGTGTAFNRIAGGAQQGGYGGGYQGGGVFNYGNYRGGYQ